jgi:DNA repair protein RadC
MTTKELKNYATLLEEAEEYITKKNEPISTPGRVFDFLYPITKDLKEEHIYALLLDSKNNLISLSQISTGTLNSCPAHPREIFKQAIINDSASIVVVHNHPTGDPTPSRQDVELTKQLIGAGKIIGIKCFDHIVIGKNIEGQFPSYYSMRRELNLDFE